MYVGPLFILDSETGFVLLKSSVAVILEKRKPVLYHNVLYSMPLIDGSYYNHIIIESVLSCSRAQLE
jgi:hypothetical protein